MGWRRKKTPSLKPRAQHPMQMPQGPQRVFREDGSIEEWSCMGHSVILPGTPAQRGLDLNSSVGWSNNTPSWLRTLRRRFLGY
jgi:hypothetical protein